ncbi:prolyl oligopeptidase family serine peptidase, partial [Idiomarina sp.]
MKYLLGAVAVSLLTACSQNVETEQEANTQSMSYPETRKGDVVDTYFGTEVADPYRWLEDDRSEETENWVKAQNEVTFAHLESIPYRETIEKRLTELWNYEKISAPFKEGDYTYFYKNDGLQNQYVVYRQKGDEEPEVFLDPNTFSEDGTTSLAQLTFSDDGSLAAYSISEGGSDWRKIIVIDAETKEQLEDPLVDIKFSGISWVGNEGFYYSSYDKPEGSELSAKTDQHKLYYHELGTDQSDDKLVFGGTDAEKHRYVGGSVTDDDRYLLISAANSTSGNKLFLKDLTDEDSELVTVLDHTDSDTRVLDNDGSKLYLVTNLDAPNQRVVTVDASNPTPENWENFIPETENVLSVSTGAGYIFAEYMVDAVAQVKQYAYNGDMVREVQLPGVGSIGGFSGKKEADELYYTFTNYSTPSTIYKFDPDQGGSEVYAESGADFDSANYESKQVFYTSKDGTEVPMIITYKKGTELDGSNPTILYGYGGFNISLTPSFSIANAAWLEMGGVYAVANLRGGGEYGKDWHKAGTKLQKQNVFDDFIAAAEYL